jgi:hypothetical protein
MLRRQGLILLSLALINGLSVGCSTIGIKNGVPYFSRKEQWEPEIEDDKWASVGQQGRGNRALEDENDPVKGIIMSKKAQDIERNLGYK